MTNMSKPYYKLIVAKNKLQTVRNQINLYTSRLTAANQKLKELGEQQIELSLLIGQLKEKRSGQQSRI